MSDRPIGLGKVADNGTLNENGAFYSVQDINVLLEQKAELPAPTVADAGKAVVVDEEGKYALGEGGSDLPTPTVADAGKVPMANNQNEYELISLSGLCIVADGSMNKSYNDIVNLFSKGVIPFYRDEATGDICFCYNYHYDEPDYLVKFASILFVATSPSDNLILD